MIISHSKRLVIATPTKCGTTTLESIARRPANAGLFEIVRSDFDNGKEDGDTVRRQHRMAMPYGFEDYQPVLLVRSPLSRWRSVYDYLRAPQNYSQWAHKTVAQLDFLRFLEFIVEAREEAWRRRPPREDSRAYRSPWVWVDGLHHSMRFLSTNAGRKPKMLRLETLARDLPKLINSKADLRLVHSNRSTSRTELPPRIPKTLQSKLELPEEMETIG